MVSEEIEALRRTVVPLVGDWQSLDIRAVAVRGHKKDWILNTLRVVAAPDHPASPVLEGLPRTEDLSVFHVRRDVSEFGEVWEAIATGQVRIKELNLDFRRANSNPPDPALYIHSWDRRTARTELGIDWTCLGLVGGDNIGGQLPHFRLRTHDNTLRSHDPPWDGMADLQREFVGLLSDEAQREDQSIIQVIVPVGVRIEEAQELDGGRISVRLVGAEAFRPDLVTVSAVAKLVDGRTHRTRFRFKEADRRPNTPPSLQTEFGFSAPAVRVQLWLVYGSLLADRTALIGRAAMSRNPRLAVVDELWDGLEPLKRFIADEHNYRKYLEPWTALAFHALGFATGAYGTLPGEAPDIVCFPRDGAWFLVLECTTREPDLGGKLSKLSTRCRELSRASGLRALPVLLTTMERSMLNQSDLEKAATEKIAIVARENLPELLQLAVDGISPTGVRDFLEQFIPPEAGVRYGHGSWRDLLEGSPPSPFS